MGKLDGKTALVTGGNSGIGFATAKQFVEEGAYVFITGRREAELAVALKEIGSDVYSQMLRKRRMSMKNAKELMLVRVFLVAMLVFASKEGLMSQTKQEQKVRNV